MDYIFRKTGQACHKSPDYNEAIKRSATLKIKEFFEASGSVDERWVEARKSDPKASEVEAAFFDICYEYGAGRLTKSDYERKYNDYNKVRKRPADSTSRADVVALTPKATNLTGEWHVFETEWLVDDPAEGFKVVNPRKDKLEFMVNLTQDGERITGRMARNSTEWTLSGYFRPPLMVFSYANTNSLIRGLGSFELVLDDQGEAFGGYVIGNDCDEGAFMKYPVVMMKNKDRKVAELYFQKHLDQKGRLILNSRECPKR